MFRATTLDTMNPGVRVGPDQFRPYLRYRKPTRLITTMTQLLVVLFHQAPWLLRRAQNIRIHSEIVFDVAQYRIPQDLET